MGKMKFYAIKTSSMQKIVTSWPECEKLSHGVKGCLFKSFASCEEAESWLTGLTSQAEPGGLRIYVDGSFSPEFDRAGWAFIAVENDREIASESGVTEFPAESRNIDGELTASLRAMAWLRRVGKSGVICHDYEGIARWAKGDWKAKKAVSQRYVRDVQKYLPVQFEKVPAHSGVKWNEAVDERAKKAIELARKKESLSVLPTTPKNIPPLNPEKKAEKPKNFSVQEQMDLFG